MTSYGSGVCDCFLGGFVCVYVCSQVIQKKDEKGRVPDGHGEKCVMDILMILVQEQTSIRPLLHTRHCTLFQ